MLPSSSSEEPAGSSSGVQLVTHDTVIRSRHLPADVGNVTAPPAAATIPTLAEEGGSDNGHQWSDTEQSALPESPRSASPAAAPASAESPRTKTPTEEKQCRICLAGPEEEEELGRLISPCHCRGSIRYVHVNCLKQWRTMSQSQSAFWSCPQCGFRYALARTRALGLATSPVILSSASVMLFTIIVLLSSFVGTWFVPDAGALNEPSASTRRASDSDSIYSFGFVISPLDYYTYSWDTAKDMFKLAVRTFGDISNSDEFWKNDEDGDDDRNRDIVDEASYERVRGSSGGFKNTVKVSQKKKTRQKSTKRKARAPPSKFGRIIRGFIYRFTTGLGVVGILSFLNLIFSFGLVAPLRLLGGNWTRGQRGRGAANDTASLVIVIFILIGVVRAVWLVYKLTRHLAQLLLRRAETAILEVGQPDEDVPPEPWGPYLKRVARELPGQIRAIPYRLLPGMIVTWAAMALVQAWHITRDWTREAVGQMVQVGPQPAVPVVGHQRGVFLGDW